MMKDLKFIPIYFMLIILVNSLNAESFKSSFFTNTLESHPNQKITHDCKAFTCGPTTVINLHPNGANNLMSPNYEMGAKGFFSQMMGIGEAFGDKGAAGVINHTLSKHELPSKLSSIHDKTRIVLPMIDYGFTGSFNNILISVSNTQPKYDYASIIMGLTDRDDTRVFTGTVVIEEYSPFVMRGSYSAPLNRYEGIAPKDLKCPAFSDPSSPPCVVRKLTGTGKINGTFTINTPAGAINKYPSTETSNDIDPFISDIKSMAAAYGVEMEVDLDEVVRDAGVKDSTPRVNASVVKNRCNCSCNYLKSSTSTCEKICKQAFAVCKGERYGKKVNKQQKVEPLKQPSAKVEKKERSIPNMSIIPPEAREMMNQLPKELRDKLMQQYGK